MEEMEVTQLFDSFREASRHIWNCFCKKGDWDQQHEFADVEWALFRTIVLYPLGLGKLGYPATHIGNTDKFRIFKLVLTGSCGAPVMISRDPEPKGSWDHSVTVLRADQADIRFSHFFDWDQIGFRNWQYYYGNIVKADTELLVQGHAVLIDAQYAKIFLTE